MHERMLSREIKPIIDLSTKCMQVRKIRKKLSRTEIDLSSQQCAEIEISRNSIFFRGKMARFVVKTVREMCF